MIPNVPNYYLCNYPRIKVTFHENSAILLKLKSEKIDEDELKMAAFMENSSISR